MGTNVTNGTIRKKQQIAFKRLIRGESPSLKITEYIGLNFFELKQWLAPKMLVGMNWNNYGEIWIIEQLVGLDFFDLTKEEDCKLAWSFKNMIPVFVEDIFHIREQCTFSLKYLEKAEKCPIIDKLVAILREQVKEQEKYFKYI